MSNIDVRVKLDSELSWGRLLFARPSPCQSESSSPTVISTQEGSHQQLAAYIGGYFNDINIKASVVNKPI